MKGPQHRILIKIEESGSGPFCGTAALLLHGRGTFPASRVILRLRMFRRVSTDVLEA